MLARFFSLPAHQRRLLMHFFIVMLGIGLIFALMPSPETGVFKLNDKILHISSFFAYAVLLDMASSRDFWRFQFLLLVGYGALIEVLQFFMPWRTFSLLDLTADALGIVLYWVLFRVLLKVKLST